MKILLTLFVFFFSSLVFAEDISDFEIEGMSIGDSLLDYMNEDEIKFYQSADHFFKSKSNQRIILMTTKASISYTKFKFDRNDTILFGRESAGVPDGIHKLIKDRLKIPMKNKKRSLNIASSVAIVLAESLKQNELI